MIETLEDIIEQLANAVGVYGAHDENKCPESKTCRCCWTANLRARIEGAIEVERKLRA